MTETEIQNLAEAIPAFYRRVLPKVPLARLDYSWPSISLVELPLRALVGKTTLEPSEQWLVQSAAAYLSVAAKRAWGPKAQVECKQGDAGISLHFQEGESSKQMIPVEQSLRAILVKPPVPFPVFNGVFRPRSSYESFIDLFYQGLVSGLSPYGMGDWDDETIESRKDRVDEMNRLLAKQTAEYYAEVYSDEQLGQVAELYLHQLIYPPTLVSEQTHCQSSVIGLMNFIEEHGVTHSAAQTLAFNLARFPDARIADTALVYLLASVSNAPDSFIALCESRVLGMAALRPAVLETRRKLGLMVDWVDQKEFSQAARRRFHFEFITGLIPWVRCGEPCIEKHFSDPRFHELLHALVRFNHARAMTFCTELVDEDPTDIDLRLQLHYLDLVSGDFDAAERGIKRLISEPEAEKSASLFDLWALICQATDASEDAIRYAQKAFSRCTEDHELYSDIANNYAIILAQTGKFEEALRLVDNALRHSKRQFTLLLNRRSFLEGLGRIQEAKGVQDTLLSMAPFQQEVFLGQFGVLGDGER